MKTKNIIFSKQKTFSHRKCNFYCKEKQTQVTKAALQSYYVNVWCNKVRYASFFPLSVWKWSCWSYCSAQIRYLFFTAGIVFSNQNIDRISEKFLQVRSSRLGKSCNCYSHCDKNFHKISIESFSSHENKEIPMNCSFKSSVHRPWRAFERVKKAFGVYPWISERSSSPS